MWASASLAFRANNGDIMRVSVRTYHIEAADAAKIGDSAKIAGNFALSTAAAPGGLRFS
jgi:hypothetical protein